MGAYYIFSCLAMLLYWALLVDFAVPWQWARVWLNFQSCGFSVWVIAGLDVLNFVIFLSVNSLCESGFFTTLNSLFVSWFFVKIDFRFFEASGSQNQVLKLKQTRPEIGQLVPDDHPLVWMEKSRFWYQPNIGAKTYLSMVNDSWVVSGCFV